MLCIEQLPRVNVTFYTMKGGLANNELAEIVTLEDKPVNHLYWSPQGQVCTHCV
jgi:hypothetical protein